MSNYVKDCQYPLLSVIVPAYNVEKYIDQCVETLLNQTYRNIEVILVDDGSKDSSGEKCDKWCESDTRVKVVHKKNAGLGEARNTGMEYASGDFIAFVDSDDYIAEVDAYERLMMKALECDADMVTGGYYREKDDGSKEICVDFKDEKIFSGDEIKQLALSYVLPKCKFSLQRLAPSAWNSVYKKSIADNLFVSERKIGSEDLLYKLETVLRAGRIVFIPYPFYFYRYNSNSLTHTFNFNLLERYQLLTSLINQTFQKFDVNQKADYLMLYIAVNIVIQMHTCKIPIKERNMYIKRLCKEGNWKEMNIPTEILTIMEKVYFQLLRHSPGSLFLITEVYYFIKKLRLFS